MICPKVLLVEDDAAVRRFVDAALEDLGIELHISGTIAQALAELEAASFALVLTDLMLVGESGQTLVRRLQAEPGLGGGPRVAVYSAGLTPDIGAELSQLGAWRLLHKPVPVEALRQCVRDAIDATPPPPEAAVRPAPVGVVQTYFGGNERIYLAYRDSCEQQFPIDLDMGSRAFDAQDAQAMRHLCHSLKSVLLALGHEQMAATARAIDVACASGDWATVRTDWPTLRAGLSKLIPART